MLAPMNLLIVSVPAGSGHTRAAQALVDTAQTTHPDMNISHINLLDYLRSPMHSAVVTAYDMAVKHTPELWGYMYEKTNSPKMYKRLEKMKRQLLKMKRADLDSYLETYKPDYILSTHFLPPMFFDHPRTGTLITDYDFHEVWLSEGKEDYFVASEKISWKLARRGISEDRIHQTGIPIDPDFFSLPNKEALRKKEDISTKERVALVLSGGQGLSHTDEIVETMFESEDLDRIIAVAGNNEALFEKLQKQRAPKHISYDVIGWTDRMHEYMGLADVVVSKPGGLTTTECLAVGTPLIAVSPIPGQEEQNAEYIVRNNLGLPAQTPDDLLYAIATIDKQQKKTEPMSSAKKILDIISS